MPGVEVVDGGLARAGEFFDEIDNPRACHVTVALRLGHRGELGYWRFSEGSSGWLNPISSRLATNHFA